MAIIKCKMCGGDIEISADKTFGTCEYCGSTMTLPRVDDEQRAAAFNRGNHFRRSGEFDKALAVYERIVAEDDNDAEAHWCCALCRFGIEYVEDPATYEWLPTCHRASFDSFLEDVDYLAAVEHSDGITRRQYQKDAAKIAEVQRGILATSQNEQPFDVFLCYKETGEDGQRTRDSLMAQEVYYELTEQGYRVFFARITLEDKAGAEYEPYIFAALNSAKVMVVIGTKPEHFNAVWVKNEWSRFLSMMKKDRSKLLLPCYRDMDPYDLPEALSVLQSYDMSKIGFMQDLIRGVKKVIDAGKPQEAVKETVKETVVVHNEGGSNVQALLDRGQMALEDGEWTKADEFFEQVLNQDAECGAAYLGKFLASKKSKNTQDFVQSYLSTAEASAPTAKNAEACSKDSDFIKACIEKYVIAPYLTEKEIRQELVFDRAYCAERSAFFQAAVDTAKELLDRDKNFVRAEKYSSGDAKEQCEILRTGLVDALHQKSEVSKQAEKAEQAHITEAYRAFLHEAEQHLAVRHKESLAQKQKADAEKQRRRMEQEKLEQEEAAKEAKRRKVRIIIGGVVAAAIAIVIIVTQIIIPSANYSKAAELQAAGDYDAAIAMYAELGDFKDSADLKAQAEAKKRELEEEKQKLLKAQAYADAEALLINNDFDGAIEEFKKISGYKDADERVLEAYYQKADSLQSAGNDKAAAIAFGQSDGYKDSRERSITLWNTIAEHPTLAVGRRHTVGIRSDGTVAAVGGNDDGQCETSAFSDIIAVAAGNFHTVGLRADGTVVSCGKTTNKQCDVSSWENIVSIAAGGNHTVGLKIDGTVLATGSNVCGQLNVSSWRNIVAISANISHTVGLTASGKVVAVGSNNDEQLQVSVWDNITAIAAGMRHTVGLKADGTVVAVGNNADGQCDVSDWTDIVAIAAGTNFTVGLKSDGTIITTSIPKGSMYYYGQNNVTTFTDIVEIVANGYQSIGLKSDGTVVAVGNNDYGQCDVSDWTDIKLPNK